jgi:pyruvate carboxylase subunit B
MAKEIKLGLVYRDMWQSSGKYMPRVDQLCKVAPAIVDMGCFARVETNGGGFEQINLLFGENPNTAVRKWTQAFNDAGIQTHMLERGLNGIRMSPVAADIRHLMFKVKKKQGTDISRSFDGLNNTRNLALSFQYAREAGMVAQGALSITHSPLHTVDYYITLADEFLDAGAEEICIKDMAGIGRPVTIGKIVQGIRKRHPNVLISYHGHSTPGFSIVSSLEAARNGADIIDVGMEPLSWGTGHADLLSVHEMLKDAGFSVPDINMAAYMEVRSMTQEFIDDFLGYYINPKNRMMSSLLLGPGLPGGMMGSLMSDLEKNLESLNKWLTKRNKATLTQDELLIKLFKEVEYVWPKLGYPPLVTPFSQYVKNTALMNVLQMEKGAQRWSMLDENTWGMILGKSGQLLGPLGSDIIALAESQEREFFNGNPQDLYPDELEVFGMKMTEKAWDFGRDDEELLEYAMHPAEYEAFKSGEAKTAFLKDLEAKRAAADLIQNPVQKEVDVSKARQMLISVDGEQFKVEIAFPGDQNGQHAGETKEKSLPQANEKTVDILAPLEGKFFLTKDTNEKAKKVGDKVKAGDIVAYIEAMKVINAVSADKSGTIVEIVKNHGDEVEEDDVILKLV